MDPEPDDIQVQVLQTTLAEIESSRQNNKDTQEINCCVICLDAITEPCTSLPCSHTNFDFICLISWLQQRASCPLCKASVTQVRYSDPNKEGLSPSIYSVPQKPAEQTSSTSNHPPPQSSSSSSAPYATRFNLPPRRRRRSPPRPPPSPDSALEFRRHVYRHNLYSLHIGSNPLSRYLPSPPSPAAISSTPHLLSRIRLWLRRELQAFSSSTTTSNREFLLEYVIAILKTVDIQSSTGQAESMLSDFFVSDKTDTTRLFLHELRNWLRSPASMSLERWDREVRYPDVDSTKRRRVVVDDDDDDDEEEEKRERRVDRGRSWTDEGGDHWRPPVVDEGMERERGKRRRD
ncbi:E3 ubiquitin-protein ligase [Cladorrhinum sp. PSN332]|nr:E3 ubiquitin-protein ligase [Cladorrhinum sp. PSN332]